MIFIHHHSDTEREESPPKNIRRIAIRIADRGGAAVANARGFVSARNAIIENVRSTPNDCGSDYWEFVIEDTDL
jgi:aspartate/methionine/tyrosine aminotransferase